MKIYFASQSFYPHIGGVSTYLLNLARELVKKDNEVVEVHLRPSGEENADDIKGIEIHRVPKEPLDREMLKNYSKFKEAIYKECHTDKGSFTQPATEMPGYNDYNKINIAFGEEVRSLLEHHPAEIVHVHDFQLLFLYRYVPRGTPLVLTWHIPFDEKISDNLKVFLVKHLNEYDRIVFSSQDYLNAAVKAGVEFEKCKIIHPICNTDLFKIMDVDKGKVREEYNIDKDCKMIMCVQRIDPKSGHEQLVRAMPKILKQGENAKLVFVGGQSMSSKLSKSRQVYVKKVMDLIKELDIEDNVIFTGNIDYPKLPKLYNAADIVALTSKTEGFGLSVTEGMSCGKPIVGTRAGGIPIQVKDGFNGYLVDVGDIDTTARRISALLKSDSLRKQIGKNSLRTVNEKFSMNIGIEKHLIMYSQLMKEKHESKRIEELELKNIRGFITDFDRTLTSDEPGDFTWRTYSKIKSINVPLILATGRSYGYVKNFLFNEKKQWDAVVAENGAIVYFPKSGKKIVSTSVHIKKIRKLFEKHRLEFTAGEVVLSTSIENKGRIEELLGEDKEFVDLIVNVDEVMLLPKGVNKGYGAGIALKELSIDPEKTIVVGDSDNDIDLFNVNGFKIAVANACEKLKLLADDVTEKSYVEGVLEIIEKIKE